MSSDRQRPGLIALWCGESVNRAQQRVNARWTNHNANLRAKESLKLVGLVVLQRQVAVPTTPGLGIEIDDDALAALHEQYLTCGIRDRDDTGYMKTVDPTSRPSAPGGSAATGQLAAYWTIGSVNT